MSPSAPGFKVSWFPGRSIHALLGNITRLFTVLFLISSAYSAEIYKWVDENGNVHFGDRPSKEQSSEKIIVKDPVKRDPEYHQHLDKQSRLLEIYREERQEDDQTRENRRKESERRKANCVIARSRLEHTRTAQYLYENTDDPLNPRVLTTEERLQETARVEAEVKHWCD